MILPAALCLLLGAPALAKELPHPPSAWALPPAAIADLCEDSLRRAETALRAAAAVPAEGRTFANTPAALEAALQDLEDSAAPPLLLVRTSTVPAVREAGSLCEARLDAFAADLPSRPELYRAVEEFSARRQVLSAEDQALLADELAVLGGGGAALEREARLELRFLRERLAAREKSFLDNLDWPRPSLTFSAEELSGLPPARLAALPRQKGLLRAEAEPGLYAEFMASVRDASARRRLEFLYHNRAAAANVPVLQEILALRGRIAELRKAGTFARLALRGRLVPAPGRAQDILAAFAKRLAPQAHQVLKACQELKRRDLGPKAERGIRAWERDYYAALAAGELPRSPEPGRRLPDDGAVAGAFEVAGHLLGLGFAPAGESEVWASSVSLREVRDSRSGELLGRLYLDLRPRPGKDPRPAMFLLKAGRESAGIRTAPSCVVLASFPSARGAVEDLAAFYHELGHALAVILSRSRHARFSGAGLPADAAEAPALLLERLAWRSEAAAAVLGPERSAGDLARLLDAAQSRRLLSWPWRALDETALALADLDVHGSASEDPGKAYRRARERWALEPVTEGTHPEASAAGLVSEPLAASGRVLAALLSETLWQRWLEEGLFNPASGEHVRQTLFAPPAAALEQALRNYLGREPSWDAEPGPEAWPPAAREGPKGPAWRRRLTY